MSAVAAPHPVLTEEALAEIYAHARREYPNECCGIVFGPRDRAVAARSLACVNIQNELHAEDPVKHTRDARTAYNLGAGDLFKLQKSLRGDEPAKIVYHSHVDIDGDGATSAPPTRRPPRWTASRATRSNTWSSTSAPTARAAPRSSPGTKPRAATSRSAATQAEREAGRSRAGF